MLAQIRFHQLASVILLLGLWGCTPRQNPQDLKEKTAETTAEIKRDAKAVAAGIREGWNRDKPLDLNSASKEQLLTLPGLTAPEADRIIRDRPYRDASELITRHILSKAEYDKISDRIQASR
ncbi:MAG: helix-hairpin-helix domain-containing protein [Acidobacteria bacterium]|nr:helix-hairpin-helix domain-containing protein [Acidobacteriota bacterium]